MAKFKPGETPPGAIPISEDIAKEYQARSVAARRKNKTLAEMMRAALDEEAAPGITKGEYLIRKAINNHKDGRLSFKDLKDLGAVLGESVLNVKTDGPQIVPMPPEAIEALGKWAAKTGGETSNDGK